MKSALNATLFACLSLAGACRTAEPARAEATARQPATPVRLAPVARGPVDHPVRAAGVLGEASAVLLSFKVGGVVTRVLVDEGVRVRRGQPLAVLDPTELDAGLAQARQGVDKAERDLARVRVLHDAKSAPLVDVQNAETGLAVARATADAAAFNARHGRLLAPEDGVIDRRSIEVGEVVAPGQPAFRLSADRQRSRVRVALVDRDALALALGDRAEVRLDAQPERALPAYVSQIAATAAQGTGTFEVELTLDDASATNLPAGLTAKVAIARTELALATVPVAALVDGAGDEAALYVLAGARARRVPVQVAFLTDERAVLRAGLPAEVAEVVEQGAPLLEDGALVRVVK